MQLNCRKLPFNFQREKFRNHFQPRIALVGASHSFMAACRAHICLESFINTIKLDVERQIICHQSISQSINAKFDSSWNANTRICSVGSIHITRSIVVQIICTSNIKRHLSQDILRKRIPNTTSMLSSITCRRFQVRNMDINGEEAIISAKLHYNLSTNSPTFCRQVLWRLCRSRNTWRRKWEPLTQ